MKTRVKNKEAWKNERKREMGEWKERRKIANSDIWTRGWSIISDRPTIKPNIAIGGILVSLIYESRIPYSNRHEPASKGS